MDEKYDEDLSPWIDEDSEVLEASQIMEEDTEPYARVYQSGTDELVEIYTNASGVVKNKQ